MKENNPKGFWQSLERIPGLAAVQAEWRAFMGEDFEFAKKLLRPNGKLASSHPCMIKPDCGCYHDVVIHGDDDIVAVCHCERGCEIFALKKADIIVYELNRNALETSLVEVFGLFKESKSDTDIRGTIHVGVYSPFAGFRFPVYLTMQLEIDDFKGVVDALLGRNNSSFILLIPTRDHLTARTEKLLMDKKSIAVVLSETAEITDNHKIHSLLSLDSILQEFRTVNLPSSDHDGAIAFFPTPADAKWSDVSVQFKDGYTVSIKVKSVSGVFNYTQMGMANKKNSNPTVQWDLLSTFATEHGTLDWTSSQAHRRNQKRREILAANLRAFFRIEGDPFRLTKDGKGWQSRFQLYPG